MSRKPVAGGRRLRRRYQQAMPEMGVRQGVGTRQSELFGGSAAMAAMVVAVVSTMASLLALPKWFESSEKTSRRE